MGHRYETVAPLLQREITTAMTRATLAVEAEAKRLVPVDTGNLRRSITHEVRASGGLVVGKVGSNAPYARIVEDGRTPGAMPPPGVLLGWMGRHGIPAGREFIIRRAVNRRKIPRPYLGPAVQKLIRQINAEFGQVPRRVLARLAAHP